MADKYGYGQILKENVTGFEGAVIAITHYATGCTHYSLVPLEMKDGVPQEWQSFDESRLSDTGKIKDVGPMTVGKATPKKATSGPAPKVKQW